MPESLKFLRTPFLQNTFGRLLLKNFTLQIFDKVLNGIIQILRQAKIAFFDPATLHNHVLSSLFTRTLLRYVKLSTNTPATPLPIKNKNLEFKKDRSRSK